MGRYELTLILENSSYAHRQEWEQTRQQMYIVAQVNSKKRLKPTDIMSFEWEKKEKEENDRQSASNKEKERLSALASRMSKQK